MSIENLELNIQSETKVESEIETVKVKDFSEAVDIVLSREQSSSPDRESFCLVDIDGALIENDLLKLPFLSHLLKLKPEISKENQESFINLCNGLEDKVAIATNRGEKNNIIWKSGEIINTTKSFLQRIDRKIPIFDLLFRQKTEFSKEDIANISKVENGERMDMIEGDLKISRAKADALVHYIGKAIQEEGKNSLDLYFIEDWSFVSLNRNAFLNYLAKGLRREYAIDSNLVSVVIKSSFL
jgi:hypothetical protein